jgi:hypothetical protein
MRFRDSWDWRVESQIGMAGTSEEDENDLTRTFFEEV